MSRKETDQFIRAIADATKLDFYYVERMLAKFVDNQVESKFETLQKEITDVEWRAKTNGMTTSM